MSSSTIDGIFDTAVTQAGQTLALVLGTIILLGVAIYAFRLGWKYFKKMVR